MAMKFDDFKYTARDKREFYEAEPPKVFDECQNCGRPSEELVHLEEWNFMACPDCARECRLTEEAEKQCPALLSQVILAKGLREIEALVKAHPSSGCKLCGSSRKVIQSNTSTNSDEAA